MPSDPFEALGEFLTATEAAALAALLDSDRPTVHALREVNPARSERVKHLLSEAGLGHVNREHSVAVLRAIAGAKAVRHEVTPVWTMPGNEAELGRLMGEFHRLVDGARQSVTCATYNFETTSKMWTVLKAASERSGVVVTVYVDGEKADAAKVKEQLPRATIYRSGTLADGRHVVSHAKFVVIDHAMVLLTSANFSYSAEHRNVEFGVLMHDDGLARSVEETMTSKHGSLYELVET